MARKMRDIGVAAGKIFHAEAQRGRGAEKKMRDSGVDWIGKIPEGWEVMRLKSIFEYRKGLSITKADLTPTGIPVISYGQIHSKENTGTHLQDSLLRFVPMKYLESDSDCLLHEDDFVFADTSEDLEGLGNCAYVDRENKIFAGYHTIVFRPNATQRGRQFFCYLAYLFKTDIWRSQFRAKALGIKVYSLSQRLLNDCSLILPPLAEQKAIAAYLDEKCAAIDAAVTEAKKGIEEYKSWKKSLIFAAVNGEWKKRRLRFLADITTGNKDTQDAEPEGAYPFYVRSPIVERSSSYTFEGPGILMAGDGAGAGRVFHYAEGKYAVHQRVYRIYNFLGIEGRFLLYSLGAIFPLEMDKGSAQSTVPSVRLPMLKDLPIPLPPLPEQQAIADYLDGKCAAIDALVAEKEALIADLEAYKKSLIFEVVTGKREVA
ncbi:MAG: restriction endonuclease subunit S [Kiritimatiellae bacterium]|nr:restriction endonuclease subunit S [Kiritimatiellia bacterium]